MLTRDQIYTLLILRKRGDNIFFGASDETPAYFPDEIFFKILDANSNGDINIALSLAASGTKEDMAILVGMIKKNPRLLLQAGNIKNRGGVFCKRKTLYEFLLGEGDPAGATQIEFGFARIPNGEEERIRQYERYRPYIEALAQQVESQQPTFDLRPLIEIIKRSSAADITDMLTINDPIKLEMRNTPLRAEFVKFRRAVSPKNEVGVGMHYEHYTTLMQGLKLLNDEWLALSNIYMDYDKCRLVWRQIIGFLQLSLPAVDRFALARAFDDDERTVEYKYDSGSFPDTGDTDDLNLVGVGFDEAIYGLRAPLAMLGFDSDGRMPLLFEKHMSSKNLKLAELMRQHPTRCCVIL